VDVTDNACTEHMQYMHVRRVTHNAVSKTLTFGD